MQGWKHFIPTEEKITYINQLLKVGFDTIDFGSFVSSKAIPQMADTETVVRSIDTSNSISKLLAIVANQRGAAAACSFEQIHYLGFPFSISETFQRRNANSTIAQSVERVKRIQELCTQNNKELILYISMGFGNPYGDPYNPEIVSHWISELKGLGIRLFMLSDTVGVALPDTIRYLFSSLIPAFPDLEIGAHLHTAPHNWKVKVDAAYQNGCRRFDAAIKGYGGCPMAKDELIGNMATENLINYFSAEQLGPAFSIPSFEESLREANTLFPH